MFSNFVTAFGNQIGLNSVNNLKYLALISLKIKIFSSKLSSYAVMFDNLTLYLIEMPFNNFATRADPDQAALVRAA